MMLLANCHVAALKASEIQYARDGVLDKDRPFNLGDWANASYRSSSLHPIFFREGGLDPDPDLSIARCPLQRPIGFGRPSIEAWRGA